MVRLFLILLLTADLLFPISAAGAEKESWAYLGKTVDGDQYHLHLQRFRIGEGTYAGLIRTTTSNRKIEVFYVMVKQHDCAVDREGGMARAIDMGGKQINEVGWARGDGSMLATIADQICYEGSLLEARIMLEDIARKNADLPGTKRTQKPE